MCGCHADSEKDSEMLSLENCSCSGSSGLDLIVQGKPLHYQGARDVRSLLESQGENAIYANVRINGEVLSRRDFENIPLSEGDEIDFLYYMGGGALRPPGERCPADRIYYTEPEVK